MLPGIVTMVTNGDFREKPEVLVSGLYWLNKSFCSAPLKFHVNDLDDLSLFKVLKVGYKLLYTLRNRNGLPTN